MARIKGNNTPVLTFKNGAAALKDVSAWLVSIEFVDGDGEALTFTDFNTGVRPVAISMEFALDFATDSAYDYFYANAGATGVTYHWKPTTAATSQTNPDFSGTVTMPAVPLFGLDASNDYQTFTVEAQCDTFTKAIS